MRVLVTGGRDYADVDTVAKALDSFLREYGAANLIIIEGEARGADRLAREWAYRNKVHWAGVPAQWEPDHYGRSAGPIRNGAMLLLDPDVCVAFPGGSGTANMVRKATAKGIAVDDYR